MSTRFASGSALVTGGASGLGEAASRMLAAAGARVTIVDMNEQRAKALAEELDGEHVVVDVVDPEAVQRAVDVASSDRPLRWVINCAGIGAAMRTVGLRDGKPTPHDFDTFRRVVDVNLVGTFNVIRLAGVSMAGNEPDDRGERGAIVNTASVAAEDGQIGQVAYSASKAGVVGMTLPIARDLAVVGIRVNTILPGPIDTPAMQYPQAEALNQRLVAALAFPRRMGDPAEFASLCRELLSNQFLNAESIRLDAGGRMPAR